MMQGSSGASNRLHLERRNFFLHREASRIKHGIREGWWRVLGIKGRRWKFKPVLANAGRVVSWRGGLRGILAVASSNEAVILRPSFGFSTLSGHGGRVAVENGARR
jgi:hypothetical protein